MDGQTNKNERSYRDHPLRRDLINILYFFSFVAVSLSKLVRISPPKLLNGLSSYFQGMFRQTPIYASNNYFFNMSVRLSVNQLSISLSHFH